MLTHVAIDGFKTFQDFSQSFGPFSVVVGPNASGKSNLFDAPRPLPLLAARDLRSAVNDLRGEVEEVFRCSADGTPGNRLTLTADVLLDRWVRDPWGAERELTHTRIRYVVAIERRADQRGIERLTVTREEAHPILAKSDGWLPGSSSPSASFKRTYMRYRKQTPFLSTSTRDEDGAPFFQIHYDGQAGRTRPAQAAEATVLSSITSAEFPHLFALREELRRWRFLQLDPASLRRPSPTTAPETLEPDGKNLATVLARIRAETATEAQPDGIVADIAADLASLIPWVEGVRVLEDTPRREFRIDVVMRDGTPFSSRVVSDGTLRVLALLTAIHDPKQGGLICFEEPENGVHPARLPRLIECLRDRVSAPHAEEQDAAEPLSQMLLNSHSPVVLKALNPGERLFADLTTVVGPGSRAERRTRLRPVVDAPQEELFDGPVANRWEVERYLSHAAPPE